jgi:hypothetical protein
MCVTCSLIFLKSNTQQYEDYTTYLPPGWTEEKFKTHTMTDFMELTNDVLALSFLTLSHINTDRQQSNNKK